MAKKKAQKIMFCRPGPTNLHVPINYLRRAIKPALIYSEYDT